MIGMSRRMTVSVDGSYSSPQSEVELAVDQLLVHLGQDQTGALSLDEFALGVRTVPRLAELFARYDERSPLGNDGDGGVKREQSPPHVLVSPDQKDEGCVCGCVVS
eukprot:TRINITY_DN29603_c0_g1_i1.p2 TRINITY_DN29603_c0_g1~~TRINITY_DN29603_c0_g1_i1.p2  ORF type:complete len:106 (-),score=8.65 TRINITY_DN29603_c0_g1_i1:93-410(-)